MTEDDDPALQAYLDDLDQQMALYPELIIEADEAQLERIAKLVEGVELEDEEVLLDILPGLKAGDSRLHNQGFLFH